MTETLRILSYNIHKGFSVGNFLYVLSEIKEALFSLPLDLVLLQEVVGSGDSALPSSYIESQFEFLADERWPYHAYGKNAIYTGGDHGNAIISRYPITRYENINISTNRFEKRGMLHAEIQLPFFEKPFHCFNLHLDLLHRGRLKQLIQISEHIRTYCCQDDSLLLAGDFNDWSLQVSRILRDRSGLSEVFEFLHGSYATTFPSTFPLLKLDRLYTQGITPLNARVLSGHPWNRLSDHSPLYAEFRFPS